MLCFVVGLEKGVVLVYLGVMLNFYMCDLIKVVVSILGDEIMYWVVLFFVFGEDLVLVVFIS